MFAGRSEICLLEERQQLFRILENVNPWNVPKLFDRCELMIVPVFTEGGATGHEEYRLAQLLRGQDRADARVSNDNPRLGKSCIKFLRAQEFDSLEIPGDVISLSNLPEDRFIEFFSDAIHDINHPVERQLPANGHKNQRTAP